MIVAVNGKEILKLESKIEDNSIEFKLYRGRYNRVQKLIREFNLIDYDIKASNILCGIDSTKKEDVRDAFVNFILNEVFNREVDIIDFDIEEGVREVARNFQGENIDLIDNLYAFNGNNLPMEVIELVKSQMTNLSEIDIKNIDVEDKNKEIEDWCIYLGNNEKYKGCIGKVVRYREQRQTSHLVECPNKFKDSGSQGRVWANPKNLVFFKDIIKGAN